MSQSMLSNIDAARVRERPVELLPANTAADFGAIAFGWIAPTFRADRVAEAFEEEFARLHGGGFVSTFAAGRVALAAILEALGIDRDDEVIIPGYTCVAVPNPVLFRGAKPVYADIDPSTLNISAESVSRVLSARTRAIVAQHTFGLPAPMASLATLARQHGIPLIEDCTHALGATIDHKLVGTFGDAAFFSFEQTKVVSAGAGGVAFSRDQELGARIAAFQARCIAQPTQDARRLMAYLAYTVVLRDPRWTDRLPHAGYYLSRLRIIAGPETTDAEMACEKPPGFERRWSGAQARVGLSQLRQLGANLWRRRTIAEIYLAGLTGSRIGLFRPPSSAAPSFVRYPVRVRNKRRLATELRQSGIQLGMWFTAPVHPEGVPQARAGYSSGSCPHAEAAVADVANLPCHPRMTPDDARRVVEAVLCSDHA